MWNWLSLYVKESLTRKDDFPVGKRATELLLNGP